MRRLRGFDPTLLALAMVVLVGAAAALWRAPSESGPTPGDGASLGGVLGEGARGEGFARVTGPRPLRFPADHGAHPDYRSEWWYVTGNLSDRRGRDYGFQLTFFRFALAPGMPERASAWATRQAWMAHFAITDVAAGAHHAAERLQRGALGLAGAAVRPFRVWLDDWAMAATAEAGDDPFPMRLTAEVDGRRLALTLRARKPLVLQGERGYSPKSDAPGNASHYYSYTRLAARGELTVDGVSRPVTGSAWLDREWSTSALGEDQAGWDWFALQLSDGRDLMVYRLRRDDGTVDPASAGVVVGADGSKTPLSAGDFQLSPRRYWRSPASGVRYPVAWRLRVPRAGVDAVVSARVDDQEMDLGFRYWEGSVSVRPGPAGPPVRGRGYLEMTGYARGDAAPAPR